MIVKVAKCAAEDFKREYSKDEIYGQMVKIYFAYDPGVVYKGEKGKNISINVIFDGIIDREGDIEMQLIKMVEILIGDEIE